jgi:hypothetical protein
MHSSLDTVVARAKTTQESIIGFKKTVVPSYLRSGGDEEKELVEGRRRFSIQTLSTIAATASTRTAR